MMVNTALRKIRQEFESLKPARTAQQVPIFKNKSKKRYGRGEIRKYQE